MGFVFFQSKYFFSIRDAAENVFGYKLSRHYFFLHIFFLSEYFFCQCSIKFADRNLFLQQKNPQPHPSCQMNMMPFHCNTAVIYHIVTLGCIQSQVVILYYDQVSCIKITPFPLTRGPNTFVQASWVAVNSQQLMFVLWQGGNISEYSKYFSLVVKIGSIKDKDPL